MTVPEPFVDIHCHLIPGVDDGAKSWQESLGMAEIAVADGFSTVIATPHQLGSYAHNDGHAIRQRTAELQRQLENHGIPLRVLPGGDVRIDESLLAGIRSGQVVTLGDHRKHVLLELPHELYFPLDGLLSSLSDAGLVGVLSHPERNQGLLKAPHEVARLVELGCLMQLTCGSLMGTFGPACLQMAEWMLAHSLVHFLATDAHGANSRRPLMRRAFERLAQLADEETALEVCCRNPAAVAAGQQVANNRRGAKKRSLTHWLNWRKAG